MKSTLRCLLLLCLIFLFNNSSFAQKYTIEDFYKVDSLAINAQPKDALKLINTINNQARAEGNTTLLIKSVVYRMLFQSYLEENAFDKILADLKQDIQSAKQPEKSVLQLLLAEVYWGYFQQNRYKLAQRTNVKGDIGDDIKTWSIQQLTEKIIGTFVVSLSEKELLQKTRIDILNEILAGNKQYRELRPTLYDLLAHRAIDIFTNTQLNLTQEESENLDFNDPIWLADQQTFSKINIKETDSTSFNTKAIQLFKELIAFHKNANHTSALADVELKRLNFFYQRNNSSEKTELYAAALAKLATQSPQTEIYSEVLVEEAFLHKNSKLQIDTNKLNLIKAVELAKKAISANPKSIGAENAQGLIKQIEAKALGIQTKNFIQPNKAAQLQLSYKNLDTVYLQLFAGTNELYLKDKTAFVDFLKSHQAIKKWMVVLPKSTDYQTHTLIDQIDGLEIGNYLLVAQSTKKEEAATVYNTNKFKVASLAVTFRYWQNKHQYFVSDLSSGKPVKGVKIQQRLRNYNEYFDGASLVTNEAGYAETPELSTENSIVSLGKEQLTINVSNYGYDGYDKDRDKHVILFTDRPIYRPGQTVFYKGLSIQEVDGINKIVANDTLDVTFEDVNGKEIAAANMITNEFGTFQGSFAIPMGKLNGQMRIETDYGAIDVQVEEYKRPTFEVVFDKPDQKYKLNDSIKVQGKAIAFAGYQVGNAKVTYTVSRKPKYDYRIYGSYFAPVQVAIGKTVTDKTGKFELNFFAKAPNENQNYAYEIKADIMDLNGETRTSTTIVTVGKKDLALNLYLPKQLFTAKADSIPFTLQNLNNEPIKGALKIEWQLLQEPNRLTNKSPFYGERYNMSRDEFIRNFPDADYNNESDPNKWAVKKIQWQQEILADKGFGYLTYNSKVLPAGYYKVKTSATTIQNDTVTVINYVRIYGTEPTTIQTAQEWVVAEFNAVKVKENAVFRIAGLKPESKVYYEVYYRDKIEDKGWINVSPQQTLFKVKAKETYENGFAVQFSMVQDGVSYTSVEKIFILDDQKQLDIKFLSFRNKLQPGEKETWKLQISNKAGEKQLAEMVATLYDASLNEFKTMDWENNFNRAFNYDSYLLSYRVNELNNGYDHWFLHSYENYFSPKLKTYEGLDLFGYNYYGGYNYGYHNYIKLLQNRPVRGIAKEALKKLEELKKGNTVYGVVRDNNDFILPGALITNGKASTTTNQFGVYSIDAKPGDELTVSSIGWKTVTKKIGKAKRIDITLLSDENMLSEVVVTGYGTVQKKASMTASIATVSSQEIRIRGSNNLYGSRAMDDSALEALLGKVPGIAVSDEGYLSDKGAGDTLKSGISNKLKNVVARTNFSETAFFYPQLHTDENGEINIEFTVPQSLTKYKMMGFAHTKEFKTATITNEIITQKQLAIAANAPRFFREGDTIVFSAKLNNLSGKKLKGTAFLELRNALNGKLINISVGQNKLEQKFELDNQGNEVLKWTLFIPSGLSAITYKVLARSGKYSDGEEMVIPVLPNSILVTESMPISVRGNTSKSFTMDRLMNASSSPTLRNQALTFEFTSNPIWYAVQSLPYLMEYPYECAEQTFSRFYANSFATGIINSSPKIREVFAQWQQAPTGGALLSNLEKNENLKSILLEETPWVREATNETERKKRLSALFDLNRMTQELKSNFEKLAQMQHSNGAFPWFTGMDDNQYITQHIVLGMGQLKKLKLVSDESFPAFNEMLDRAVKYLDLKLIETYKEEKDKKGFSHLPLHYLYARSYAIHKNTSPEFVAAFNYYINKVTEDWKTMDVYQQAQAALVLYRNGNQNEALKIIGLLKQTAQQSDEMGMYWANNPNGWWWYQSSVETQALLIEAFDEVASDTRSVEEMKIWLLKNKQTNDWKTTKATVAACYALLMKGTNLLAESAAPEILIGNQNLNTLNGSNVPTEAGTGYQKITITGANIKPAMGKIDIKNNNQTIAWGALYWQYFEQLDKITPAATGVKIKKQLFLQTHTKQGDVLTPLTLSNVLSPGDLVKVRIEIYADRDMEYVHLKDLRSSGFEPINVISEYKYQDGLGYYETTKDASTNFFISYLRKGTYVFEYPLRVTHSGSFSNGITSLQCMYAPEFTTHSEGIRVRVQ